MRAIQVDREPLRRYGHSKLSKMAAAAILNLFESKIAPLDPPSRKPHPRQRRTYCVEATEAVASAKIDVAQLKDLL